GVVVVQHATKPTLTDEAALRQGIAHGGKMLVLDAEFRFALRGRIVVVGGVLQGGPGGMRTATACGRGVANTHAFEHTGRVRWHLQALHGIEILTGLWPELRRQPYGALGQQVPQTAAVCRGFNQLKYGVIVAKGEGTAGSVIR